MRFFLKKSTQFWLPRFAVLLSTHDFVPIFFLFFPPFSRGGRGFCSGVGAQSSAKHGGERVSRNFCTANAGGKSLRATYLRQTRGGQCFFCPFFGGVFGSSVPFLFFSRGGLPKRTQQKQQEQRNLDQKKQRNKDEKKRKKRRRRRRRRNRRR